MGIPFFSIVIATYNSEKTLGYTLKSISDQTMLKNEIEILVVDGGSVDKTLEIANEYSNDSWAGFYIINNKKRLPEYAKLLGMEKATGKYLVRMDSDEEFSYSDQLLDKKKYLQMYPEIKLLIPNRYSATKRKGMGGVAGEYMNILGDPFSYFVYSTKKDKYTTYSRNIIKKDGKFALMKFRKDDVYPLADSATTVMDLQYVKKQYPNDYASIDFVCGGYDRIIADTEYCGCIKSDDIKHNCNASFRTYLSKLKFRVINNIFHKNESGFSAREVACKKLSIRKLLFCLYALVIPIPLLDSVRLAVVYRKPSFLLHFVYLYYVVFQIGFLGIVKLCGGEKINKSYGK